MAVEMLHLHPGNVLQELYLDELGLDTAALAERIGVPASVMREVGAARPGEERAPEKGR